MDESNAERSSRPHGFQDRLDTTVRHLPRRELEPVIGFEPIACRLRGDRSSEASYTGMETQT